MPSRPQTTRTSLPVVLAAAAVLLTACGSGSAAEPAVTAVPTPADASALRLPLQDYIPDAEQLHRLDSAQRILTDQCMSRYGFRFRVPDLPEAPPAEAENARRYGLYDEAAAAASGYSTHEEDRPQKPPMPSMDPAETLVLGGTGRADAKTMPRSQEEAERSGAGDGEVNGVKVPIGGCRREAYLRLWAPTAASVDPMKVQDMDAEGYDRSRQDSRVVKATEQWTSCMAEHGYHARNPVSPQAELGLDQGAFASPAGLAAAVADVGCKRRTNLVGIWFAVESAYQRSLMDGHEELLRAARSQQEDSLRLAAQLVAQG
ncbi:hypothetical protein AB0D08_18340 [Kitasatospora sp. NPDC048540]|uniref:hypothetical protein n=1 Tax=unclassified Kitasatospora TaxID=2633591 RepID=UPI000539ED1B|nr:hypothetical protein [Kitasatospora sp. MBT63]